jgi:hypothetical protein
MQFESHILMDMEQGDKYNHSLDVDSFLELEIPPHNYFYKVPFVLCSNAPHVLDDLEIAFSFHNANDMELPYTSIYPDGVLSALQTSFLFHNLVYI